MPEQKMRMKPTPCVTGAAFLLASCSCDSPSHWQRGTYENPSGQLRLYMPKGTDLSDDSQHELGMVDSHNTHPLQPLGWR